jgi:hypothetical protein
MHYSRSNPFGFSIRMICAPSRHEPTSPATNYKCSNPGLQHSQAQAAWQVANRQSHRDLCIVAGPIEQMNAPTIAMFKLFQPTLLTRVREWRDPDLERVAHAMSDAAPADAAAVKQQRLDKRDEVTPPAPGPKHARPQNET